MKNRQNHTPRLPGSRVDCRLWSGHGGATEAPTQWIH